jgi:hypothetical protein
LQKKHAVMGGQFPDGFAQTKGDDLINRSMIAIGG